MASQRSKKEFHCRRSCALSAVFLQLFHVDERVHTCNCDWNFEILRVSGSVLLLDQFNFSLLILSSGQRTNTCFQWNEAQSMKFNDSEGVRNGERERESGWM